MRLEWEPFSTTDRLFRARNHGQIVAVACNYGTPTAPVWGWALTGYPREGYGLRDVETATQAAEAAWFIARQGGRLA